MLASGGGVVHQGKPPDSAGHSAAAKHLREGLSLPGGRVRAALEESVTSEPL